MESLHTFQYYFIVIDISPPVLTNYLLLDRAINQPLTTSFTFTFYDTTEISKVTTGNFLGAFGDYSYFCGFCRSEDGQITITGLQGWKILQFAQQVIRI